MSVRRRRDHPRSRGVYDGGGAVDAVDPGIIPARAGFTGLGRGVREGVPDHPRSRGVYWDSRLSEETAAGSSPLARGLLRRRHGVAGGLGIIPARAGFTLTGPARGGCSSGSSPLARGLLSARPGDGLPARIIPARAGFTSTNPLERDPDRDHPRSRGVYATQSTAGRMWWGSSPLARGLPHLIVDVAFEKGIIPARAGFTSSNGGRSGRARDHPRSRGVYAAAVASAGTAAGSSPLARGLHTIGTAWVQVARIIPARAGFTRLRGGDAHAPQDHPRSRGVYVSRTPVSP